MMNMRGNFITIEGVEGVGKSTVINSIKEYFQDNALDVIYTREPGGTTASEEIRNLLLHNTAFQFSAETELMLMFASRVENTQEIILPALTQGKIVVSDGILMQAMHTKVVVERFHFIK